MSSSSTAQPTTVAQKIRIFGPMAATVVTICGSIIYHVWKENKELNTGSIMLILYPSLTSLVTILFDWADEIIHQLTTFVLFFTNSQRLLSSDSSSSTSTSALTSVVEIENLKLQSIHSHYDLSRIQALNNDLIASQGKINLFSFSNWFTIKSKEKKAVSLLPDGRFVSDKYRLRRNAHDIINEWEAEEYRIMIMRTQGYNVELMQCLQQIQPFISRVPESFLYRLDTSPIIQSGHVNLMWLSTAPTALMAGEKGEPRCTCITVIAVSKDFTLTSSTNREVFQTFNSWPLDLTFIMKPPNPSPYSLDKIYNEHAEEIKHTVAQYKIFAENSTARKVCCNFCFAGPTGTSKTFAARAIAQTLNRLLVEVDLKKFKTEKDFFKFISEHSTNSSVFLLDEIDLMCPTRSFDDAVLTIERKKRLSALTMDSDTTDDTEDFEFPSDRMTLTHKTMAQEKSITKLTKEMMLARVQTAVTSASAKQQQEKDQLCQAQVGMTFLEASKALASNGKVSFIDENENTEEPDCVPVTLRTLLTWIAGPHTPSNLVVIGTTNCPEKLAPELVRPGRLRLLHFRNLRKVDFCQLICETFPRDKVEALAQRIKYTDYQLSGATVEAIMSSCMTMQQLEFALTRELVH